MVCRECGEPLPADAVFCEYCGARVEDEQMLEITEEQLQPLTTAQCVLILAAFAVPVLNLVLMFGWAYGTHTNENRRSLARAGLVLTGILIGLAIIGLGGFVLFVRLGLISLTGVL